MCLLPGQIMSHCVLCIGPFFFCCVHSCRCCTAPCFPLVISSHTNLSLCIVWQIAHSPFLQSDELSVQLLVKTHPNSSSPYHLYIASFFPTCVGLLPRSPVLSSPTSMVSLLGCGLCLSPGFSVCCLISSASLIFPYLSAFLSF